MYKVESIQYEHISTTKWHKCKDLMWKSYKRMSKEAYLWFAIFPLKGSILALLHTHGEDNKT